MTKGEVTKEKKLKTKYDPSGMKASMIKQYGEEKGKQVYFATIRKQAMKEESCGDNKDTSNDSREIPTKVNMVKNKLRAMGLKMDYEPEGEVLDERRREEKGTPRKERNRATEFVRSQNKGMMTRSGRTVSQHESERGVPERDRPKKAEKTTADRLQAKRTREAASQSSRERSERDQQNRRRLG